MSQETRFRFCFGAAVEGHDGPIGTLHGVLLDPDNRCLRGLVLRTGLLFSREWRVSREALVSATEAEIRLRITAAEAAELQAKARRRLNLSSGEPADDIELCDMLPVLVPEGAVVGNLHQVLVEAASGEIVELIIETGLFARCARRLPGGWLRRITRTALEVEASAEAVSALPGFRGDRELRGDILDAWFYDDRLRATMLRAPLDVRVQEGVACVEGYAPSGEIRRRLEARARNVPGVLEVASTIVADDELALTVGHALRSDPRTRELRPEVRSSVGVVSLEGEAPDRIVCEAATAVAAAADGVRTVVNRLHIEGTDGPPVLTRLRYLRV